MNNFFYIFFYQIYIIHIVSITLLISITPLTPKETKHERQCIDNSFIVPIISDIQQPSPVYGI